MFLLLLWYKDDNIHALKTLNKINKYTNELFFADYFFSYSAQKFMTDS